MSYISKKVAGVSERFATAATRYNYNLVSVFASYNEIEEAAGASTLVSLIDFI